MKKQKNYRRRSKVYRGAGLGVVGLTTTSGFLGYQAATDFQQLEEEMNNFILVNQETLKLNMTIAIPFLIGSLVFLYIAIKKNKEYFSDKISLNILFVLFILYLVYSVIEVTMVALAGAFVGTLVDETVFLPLSKSCQKKVNESDDLDKEYDRETRRIKARKRAESDFDGSV